MDTVIKRINTTYNQFWEEDNTFQKQFENRNDEFIFYEGPPFATGKPHYGHILNSVIKDTVCRFKCLDGKKVDRVAGWDCHGLPIEYKIEEKLGIKTKEQVESFGIANYNNECRSIVLECVDSWRETMGKLGRWIDFDNSYKTMDADYMQCVWYVFKQVYERDMVYRGFRVMPYSLSCGTPLSNFEATSNYKDIPDTAITVKFNTNEGFLLVWTTTPWTLPANTALCINNNITYVKFEMNGEFYICSEHMYNLKNAFVGITVSGTRTLVDKFTGAELLKRVQKYEPIFNYNNKVSEHRILSDDFVAVDVGTGIVHLAPAFGEDDFNVCLKNGVLSKDFSNLYMPINQNGYYDQTVEKYNGMLVFDANETICRDIKTMGLLFKKEAISHSYPHCWRSDTKLIYKAVDSWFISVSKIRDDLVANNEQINWQPEHVGKQRFNNWLKGAIDWNVSRKRYWGCPIPIWENAETGQYIVVGSIDELSGLTGLVVDDIHREHIDHIEIVRDGLVYKRIPDVFDCWFESGSMPFAKGGIKNINSFKPADFISEGIDQTRGWFYTLLVISTIIHNQPPFKNVIVNGLVLAEDGKKMSKRLNNYPDPNNILENYGADALRFYLLSSPAAYGETLKFKEGDVLNVNKTIIIPILNSLNFYRDHLNLFKNIHSDFSADTDNSSNVLDDWIKFETMKLQNTVLANVERYNLNNIGKLYQDFIENLNNLYIKLNRDRFKCATKAMDSYNALHTLYQVLTNLVVLLSPICPFVTEHIHTELNRLNNVDKKSVHLYTVDDMYRFNVDGSFEYKSVLIKEFIDAIRNFRGSNYSFRIPFKSITVYIDPTYSNASIDDIMDIQKYIKNDCNILNLETRYVHFLTPRYKPNYVDYGKVLGRFYNQIISDIQKGELKSEYGGINVEIGEHILQTFEKDAAFDNVVVLPNSFCGFTIDTTYDKVTRDKYVFNEFNSYINQIRKECGLKYLDKLELDVLVENEKLREFFIEINQNGDKYESYSDNNEINIYVDSEYMYYSSADTYGKKFTYQFETKYKYDDVDNMLENTKITIYV